MSFLLMSQVITVSQRSGGQNVTSESSIACILGNLGSSRALFQVSQGQRGEDYHLRISNSNWAIFFYPRLAALTSTFSYTPIL